MANENKAGFKNGGMPNLFFLLTEIAVCAFSEIGLLNIQNHSLSG